MNNDPNYEVRTLMAPFEQGPLVPSFLRDTFFSGRDYPATNLIEFDFKRGRRKMAPFVAPIIGGKLMEREGYETRTFRAPRIAPVRGLRIPDLEVRLPGETIYEGGKTPSDRAAELLAQDAVDLDDAISRREEWMCREVLINGMLTITADHGYQMKINFMESGTTGNFVNNHETVATKWDSVGSDPISDLDRGRRNTIKQSGIAPDVALFGSNAYTAFLANAKVKELLDLRRLNIVNIEPRIESNSVTRFGSVPGLELYTYDEVFEDDNGDLFDMLPPDLVILLSTSVPNKIVYGAFTQLEDAKAKRYQTYQASRIPFVYGDEEAGNLFYRLTSLPMPMPNDILGWRIIEALGDGTYTPGEPWFNPDNTEAGA